MTVLAIDPGPTHTAWLEWGGAVWKKGFEENGKFLANLRDGFLGEGLLLCDDIVAIEMVASYGMPVGKEVFETCVVIGRIEEALRSTNLRRVYRKDIKLHLCGSMRAKDSNVRQALIDRVGPRGTKANPGPTYGLAKHDWAALAIAIYAQDTLHTPHCNAVLRRIYS